MIHGGTRLADGTRVEEHAVIGKPELGYAVGKTYDGAGAATVIGAGTVIRSGAIVYAGATIGSGTVIGHHTLLRSNASVGDRTQLGHNLTVERETRIGNGVRCSPSSHITSSCVLADHVFLGASVRTVTGHLASDWLTTLHPALPQITGPLAERWGCAVKAHGVDTAYRAVSELALLAGASGLVAGCATAKAVRDLNALLYTDGIHDSLYRAAGRTLTGHAAPDVCLPQQKAASLASG